MARIEILAYLIVVELLASLILAILKFTVFHSLSWLAVLSPFWMPAALTVFGFILLLICAVLFGGIRGRSDDDYAPQGVTDYQESEDEATSLSRFNSVDEEITTDESDIVPIESNN